MTLSTNYEVIRDEIQELTVIKVDREDRAECVWQESGIFFTKSNLVLPISQI